MVQGIPTIQVDTSNAYAASQPASDRIWATCIETTKGPVLKPTFVQTPQELYKLFKYRIDGFWGVGGQGLYIVRVTKGEATASTKTIMSTDTTPKELCIFTAKDVGSYAIYITLQESVGGGYNLIVEEDGFTTEYYAGVASIEQLCDRINSDSEIIKAEFKAEGTPVTFARQILGEGANGTRGVDGTFQNGGGTNPDGSLTNEGDAVAAHRRGLALLEDYDINGVFCLSPFTEVQVEYAIHAKEMSKPTSNKWRYAVVGGKLSEDKQAKIATAAVYNDQNVLYVGQGLIDKDGVEYEPYQATMAVAGKRSQLPYGETIWGGDPRKRLGIGNSQFFVDVIPLEHSPGYPYTKQDIKDLNEHGVITFMKSFDGVRITEGVTTVQPDNEEGEDEEAVVSIVRHAAKLAYDAAFEMLGKQITPSFKTDLEEHIKSYLSEMKYTDNTLVDVPEEGLEAYRVEATILPAPDRKLGKVRVALYITPVHAAREIKINLMVL